MAHLHTSGQPHEHADGYAVGHSHEHTGGCLDDASRDRKHAHAHDHDHGHGHGHTHHHGHGGKSLGEWNKEHFDTVAANIFQVPWVAKIAGQVSQELQNNFAWINDARRTTSTETRLLDYACGNGMVSRALASHVTTARGIDISPEMAKQYNLAAQKASIPHEKMRAIQGDLLDGTGTPSPELEVESDEYNGFDIAVMSLALHHVENADDMVQRLAGRLREGGVLVIVDWVAGPGEQDASAWRDIPAGHTVKQAGFTEDELRRTFEKAGLVDWGWKLFGEELEVPGAVGGRKQGFLARGRRTKDDDGEGA